MSGLRILSAGPRLLVVDHGFRGGRGQGIPPSGSLNPRALALLNAVLGNPPETAALEWALLPPKLQSVGGCRIALSGPGQITTAQGTSRKLAAFQATTLLPGEVLTPDRAALGLIGIGGGPILPKILGSQTTNLRAGFGGFHGRALADADLLPCAEAADLPDALLTPPAAVTGPIRCVLGPQAAHFSAAALALFTTADWQITPQADRMGLRLDGPELDFAPGRGPDIISDGIAPGAVQVPGTGRPILLLADAQTTGGYAKIATVIRADLWRLAERLPGEALRFCWVTVEEAEAALMGEAALIAAAKAQIRPLADLSGLAAANLAGQAVDALAPDHISGALLDEGGRSREGQCD